MRRLLTAAFATLILALPVRAQPLISPDALKAKLGETSLAIIDIRTGESGAGAKSYAAGHVPGAVHADYTTAGWRALKDGVTLYLPNPQVFEALVGGLGVTNESHVVIVHEGADDSDFGSAARVYWTFKAMGHKRLSILDGGFRAWKADPARPISKEAPRVEPTLYEAEPDPAIRATVADVIAAKEAGITLLDSRPEGFFSGKEKHKAVRAAGHIPGAVNQSHAVSFAPGALFKPADALAKAFAAVGGDKPTIVYCNTGHWAATNWFVLSELLGRKNVKLYDGSMLDWASDPARPVATGRQS